jgi:hypothetical protein
MDTDDIDMGYESSVSNSSATSDIEKELDYLEHYSNEYQLKLLKKEINHIVVHGVNPPESWYEERFKSIKTYSTLDWTGLMNKFSGKDAYMYNTAVHIMNIICELLNECSTKNSFNLKQYHLLIHEIQNIWSYYSKTYIGGETDLDVIDLIQGISHM